MSRESYMFLRDLSIYSSGSVNVTCHGLVVMCRFDRRDLTWSTLVELPSRWCHSSSVESFLEPAGVDPNVYRISLDSSSYRDVLGTMRVSHVNNFRYNPDGEEHDDIPYHTVGDLITTTCAIIRNIVKKKCSPNDTDYACSNRPLRTSASHRRQVPEYSPGMDIRVLIDTFSRQMREIFAHQSQILQGSTGPAERQRSRECQILSGSAGPAERQRSRECQILSGSTGPAERQRSRECQILSGSAGPDERQRSRECQMPKMNVKPQEVSLNPPRRAPMAQQYVPFISQKSQAPARSVQSDHQYDPTRDDPHNHYPRQVSPAPQQTAPARHYSEPPEPSVMAHFGTIVFDPRGQRPPTINIPNLEGLSPRENLEMRQAVMSGLVDMGVVPGSSHPCSEDRKHQILQSLVDSIERYTDMADSRHHSEMPILVDSYQNIEVPTSDNPELTGAHLVQPIPTESDEDHWSEPAVGAEAQSSTTCSSAAASEPDVSIGDCSDTE